MTRTLWLHPFNGIAGDMLLGALIDAGADADAIRSELSSLGVDGWTIRCDEVKRNGIGATDVRVEADEGHAHRTAGDIEAIVRSSDLPPRVVERAVAVFRRLADAEGAVHRTDPDTVHFHEVGGIDAIVDVVGSCVALEHLAIDRITCAPVATGRGVTGSAHGPIPHPAPATVRLLEGVPTVGLDVAVELTTPTGAALVSALADEFGPLPAMTVESSGFGAGDADLGAHPNLLHVVVGETASPDPGCRHLVVIEANVDDLSGEYLAHAVTRLLEEGALDAWVAPIEMKKRRPGAIVSALVEPVDVDRIGATLLRETGSLGYRAHGVDRRALDRRVDEVDVDGHAIRIKVTESTAKAEYDDVAAAARALGRPARTIAGEAETRWRERR